MGDTERAALEAGTVGFEAVQADLREHGFLGVMISDSHWGLGSGHFAHTAVVTRIATVNVAAIGTACRPGTDASSTAGRRG